MAEETPQKGEPDGFPLELLSEAGRASAAQEMFDVAIKMERRGKAVELAVATALSQQLIRWRRAAVVMAFAMILLLGLAFSNRVTLNEIKHASQNTDEIVDFVRCIKDHPQDASCFGPHAVTTTTTSTPVPATTESTQSG